MNIIDVSMIQVVEGIVEVAVPQIFEGRGGCFSGAAINEWCSRWRIFWMEQARCLSMLLDATLLETCFSGA